MLFVGNMYCKEQRPRCGAEKLMQHEDTDLTEHQTGLDNNASDVWMGVGVYYAGGW